MADSTYTKLFEQIYKRAEERFFEEIYMYTHLTEDTSPAYAEGLHAAIRRNGGFNNFNFTSFNNSRIPLDSLIVFGGEKHVGQENEPILENFVQGVVNSWNEKFPQEQLNKDNENIVRQAATDYYVRKLGHD